MSIPEELKEELLDEFEKHLEAVRACAMSPGSLGVIMDRAAQQMGRLTQETLAKAASKQADFPPSGVSALPRGAPLRPGKKAPTGGDALGGDSF